MPTALAQVPGACWHCKRLLPSQTQHLVAQQPAAPAYAPVVWTCAADMQIYILSADIVGVGYSWTEYVSPGPSVSGSMLPLLHCCLLYGDSSPDCRFSELVPSSSHASHHTGCSSKPQDPTSCVAQATCFQRLARTRPSCNPLQSPNRTVCLLGEHCERLVSLFTCPAQPEVRRC